MKPPYNWPGSKGAPGMAQAIVSQIPPHQFYLSPFAGFDSVAQSIRPAERRLFIDLHPDPVEYWNTQPNAKAYQRDAIQYLTAAAWSTWSPGKPPHAPFIFIDPPFHPETCDAPYTHTLTADQHKELLAIVAPMKAPAIICGYRCKDYDRALKRWRAVNLEYQSRRGRRVETIWLNYPPPAKLHDPRYIGRNKRERERRRRRERTVINTLTRLPPLERQAMLDKIYEAFPPQ